MDFKSTVLIMTTNLGTRDIKDNDAAGSYERMKTKVNEELKQHFRPEFLHRIDDIVVFHQLTEGEIIQIVDLMLNRVDTQLKNKDMGWSSRPPPSSCSPPAVTTPCSVPARCGAPSSARSRTPCPSGSSTAR